MLYWCLCYTLWYYRKISEPLICRSSEKFYLFLILHAYYGNTLDVVNCQNSCQLFGIVHAVKLRTSDERNFILDEIIVEIAVSECRTVGGDEQVGTVKIGSIDGNKLYLNGPLWELTGDSSCRSRCCFMPDSSWLWAWAAAGENAACFLRLCFLHKHLFSVVKTTDLL